jgi:hypothetical protein
MSHLTESVSPALTLTPTLTLTQVWRGALLAADYVVQQARRFDGAVVVELGAGDPSPSKPVCSAVTAAPVPCVGRCESSTLQQLRAVEGGAGTGLAGIALAAAARPRAVFVTGRLSVDLCSTRHHRCPWAAGERERGWAHTGGGNALAFKPFATR